MGKRLAAHGDVDAVDIGEKISGSVSDFAGRHCRIDMQREGHIGFRKFFEETVFEHRERSRADFFSRLADEHDRAAPFILVRNQITSRPDQASDVNVVAAGVHHADVVAVAIFSGRFRGVRETGIFRNGKGVEIGTDHDGRPGPVYDSGDNPVPADLSHVVEAELF